MALTDIPLERIVESDLQRLIDAATAESLYIDYKQSTYGGTGEQHREFLADISSFANTVGGDLVIGMTEKDGVPTGFKPFDAYPDAELRRLDDMARTGLQPRIANLGTRIVPLSKGGFIIVLRVPRSYNAPHRVIKDGSNRFWARSSASPKKYEPNVDELRSLFMLAPQIADRMREFRMDRIAKIMAKDTPAALKANCLLVLHVVPFSHFSLKPTISFSEVVEHPDYFATLKSRFAMNRQVNFDGFLVSSNEAGPEAEQRAYTQVFRNGAVEAVMSVLRNDGKLNIQDIDGTIVQHARSYAESLKACGAEAPFAVFASLIGVKGKFIMLAASQWESEGLIADRDQLHLTEVILEEVPATIPECGKILKPLLDHLANAGGAAAALSFDAGGNYVRRG